MNEQSQTASQSANKASGALRQQTPSVTSLRPIFAFIRPYTFMGVLALIALVATSTIVLSLGQGVKMVIDNGFIAGSEQQLKSALLVMIGMISLLAMGTFSRFYLMSWLGERVIADIRKAVFEKIVVLHPSYFEENRSGEITSRLITDTTLLQSIVGSSFSMALRSTLTLMGGIIMLLVTNVKLTLIVIACVPVVLVPMYVFGRRVRNLAASSQDAIAGIGTYAGEVIQNIKVVQSYGQEQAEQQAFGREVENAFAVAKRRIKQRSLLIAAAIFLVFSAISMMLWVGGSDVLSGRISGGELGAFVFYAVMVALSVATVAEVYGELQRAAGAATRLLELLQIESVIAAPLHPKSLYAATATTIEFCEVNFCYPSRPNNAALSKVNIEIQHGEIVAIVGPSGAGKTTLFDLLQRFYDPQQGNIKIHGANLKEVNLQDLRSTMGMVPQNPVLFSSDVFYNIRYGKPQAREEEVINAAKKAHAHDFIMQLPEGYKSFLGEQGVRLSGGQKQRIAIARAILKAPDILLLDEATSALDSESEHHVQAALNELMQQRTTLIIAHRLATVMHADKIVVMDKGKVATIGTHQQLITTNALYKRLCELQFDNMV
ncbi:MAG: ATP-binding cassette subfamily B protein [Pseudohongiellaceae bacterium]|jgi:ATP-binding cassette subfamily B protein